MYNFETVKVLGQNVRVFFIYFILFLFLFYCYHFYRHNIRMKFVYDKNYMTPFCWLYSSQNNLPFVTFGLIGDRATRAVQIWMQVAS